MPIIEYNTTTKAIRGAHYGREWVEEEWSDYSTENPGFAVVFVSDENTSSFRKYLQINDGVGTLHETTLMDITMSGTTLIADDSDYIDFADIPEGVDIKIDSISVGTMDGTGEFRFTAQEAGIYSIIFELLAYEPVYYEVTASDNP